MKTPDQLNITQQELDAFVWVRDMLRSGKFKHDEDEQLAEGNVFDLTLTCSEFSCGTVGCIGGWASIHMQGVKPNDKGLYLLDEEKMSISHRYVMQSGGDYNSHYNSPKRTLFFGAEDYTGDMQSVTPAQAADAIDNFLNEGDPCWGSVLAD